MNLPLPAILSEEKCQRHGWWLLLAVTALLYLPGLGILPMMDRDEPRFAHATVEMMQRDSWLVPYFNGDYRFDKPPLTYWWMRLHYHLLGVHEFAARLHTVVSTWLVAVFILGIGQRLGSARMGMLAGIAWLLTLQVLVHGRLCVADMPMVLFVTMALRAVLELLMKPQRRFIRWHWVLFIALGLGFLAKGPIAWIVPALALLLHRFVFWGRHTEWSSFHFGKGMTLALAIVGLWGIPALIQTGGLFWKVGMGEHVVERGASALNGRFPVPGYYFVTAILSLFPWIALFPQIWRRVAQRWTMTNALLLSWFVAPYVIFTFYATQLPHYVMPGFPAAMLLLGKGLDLRVKSRWRWWSWGVVAAMALAPLIALCAGLHPAMPPALRPLLLHGALTLTLIAFVGWLVVKLSQRGTRTAYGALAVAVICLPLSFAIVMRDIRNIHPAVQLRCVLGPVAPNTQCLGWQFTEPSLVYHFDHPWRFTSKQETVEKQLRKPGDTILVMLRREWTLSHTLRNDGPAKDFSKEVDQVLAAHPEFHPVEVHGFNAARSSWVELMALRAAVSP
ncbi:MAG: glycosyltransferase family 39 protein [Verrucomicrobiaceae bacterium]|nr:glycosyltransferase family 39 protein [Verrucomicrobiaceae bacterium]